MNVLRLPGVRADELLGYLKALGVLRLISAGIDPGLRAAWDDDTLVLHSKFTRAEIEPFFLDRYAPTPIVNPWNSGAGFDSKSRTKTAGKTLDRIVANTDKRWQPYRDVILMSRDVLSACAVAGESEKGQVLSALRERVSDEALQWLDAAVVVGGEALGFPPLLGSGGNDGRLDFSINFALRALDVVGEGRDRDASARWLRDALDDTSTQPRLGDVAIGQFSPGATGGPNATAGFSGPSLVNPWDFVLLLEGAVAFAGSISKRFGSGSERATFPFTFPTVAAGFGTSSANEQTRGEVWLPLWRGAATCSAVLALLRGGRLEIDLSDRGRPSQRAATSALEAAQAALSAGAATGVERFTRIVIAQRNGLAFAATPAGRIAVREDGAIATLSRSTTRWIARVQRIEIAGTLGAAARAALRAYDDAIFAYGALTERRAAARALQTALCALAELDFVIAAHPPRTKAPLAPIPFLDAGLYRSLNDDSPEHRIACALASYGHAAGAENERLRFDIEHVSLERRVLRFDPDRIVTWTQDLDSTLGLILERRIRRVSASGGRAPLAAGNGVDLHDLAAMLEGTIQLPRLRRLIAAYALIAPTQQPISAHASDEKAVVPAPFAALKLLIDGERATPETPPPALDSGIVPLLLARQPRALALVQLRLRTANFAVRSIANATLPDYTGPRYAATALIPSSLSARRALRRAALLSPQRH